MPRGKNLDETKTRSDDTKSRILEVAARAFSRKGYRATTIAEICRLAGTNIASVNYHFGNKETLYVESWRESSRRSHEKHPPNGGIAPDAPPEERLRGWLTSLVRHVVDPECNDFEILHMEFVNPTGLLTEAIRDRIKPVEAELRAILRELLGPEAREEEIQLCSMSLRSQCMNPKVFGKRHEAMAQNAQKAQSAQTSHAFIPPLSADVEAIVNHVVRFSLGGLSAVRGRRENPEETVGTRS